MFYVVKKLYGYYPEEVISKHRTEEMANKKCEKEKQKHKMYLSGGGWRTDETEFYVKEI